MPDLKSKQDLYRAINRAYEILDTPKGFYRVIKINDPSCPYHLERVRDDREKGDEVFKIRITLTPPTPAEIQTCRDYILPHKVFTCFIMEKIPKKNTFIFHKIDE